MYLFKGKMLKDPPLYANIIDGKEVHGFFVDFSALPIPEVEPKKYPKKYTLHPGKDLIIKAKPDNPVKIEILSGYVESDSGC